MSRPRSRSPAPDRSAPFTVWTVVFLCAAALVPFLPSLGNQFVWDDHEAIANNPVIRQVFPLDRFFRTQGLIQQGAIHPATGSRPLTSLSLALDHAVWGTDPFGFHLTNLLLHVLCVLAVFLLIRSVARDPIAAGFGAGLFAVLPGHAEAVIALLGRSDLLATLFVLLGFLSYLRATRRRRLVIPWFLASLALALAACLAKETGAVLVLLIAGWELAVRQRGRPAGPILRILPFAVVAAVYLVYRGSVLQGNAAGSRWWGGSAASNFLMLPGIYARYLRVLAIPVVLSPLHLVAQGSFNASLFIGTLLLAGTIALAASGLVRRSIFGFAAAWFIIALLPVANIIPVPGIYMAERWLYLPSVGLAMALGLILSRSLASRARLAAMIFGVLVAALAVRTFYWNRIWHDEDRLSRQILANSPESHLGRTMRGRVLYDQGRFLEAEAELRTALRFEPGYYLAHSTLATALSGQGRYAEAELHYRAAIRSNPCYAEARSNLGIILLFQDRPGEALSELRAAVNMSPDNYMFRCNLGTALKETGRLAEALEQFRAAVRLEPDLVDARSMIGAILALTGDLTAAERELRGILNDGCDRTDIHYNLGLVLDAQGRIAEAIAEYRIFLASDPDPGIAAAVADRIRDLQGRETDR